jgi:hypothetical protein
LRKDQCGIDYILASFTDKYSLTSLEKAFRSFDYIGDYDALTKCYKKLIKKGLLIDKEIIRFNIDMKSLI